MAEAMLSPNYFLKGNKMSNKTRGKLIVLWFLVVVWLVGMLLVQGCSMANRVDMEDIRNRNPYISHTWRF